MSLDVSLGEIETCPNCGHEIGLSSTVYTANITHNLGRMAKEAGIYTLVWCPEELNIKTASELIPFLRYAISDMKAHPNYYKQFDSPNGWGLYDNFVPWLEQYLEACIAHPNASVRASR